MLVLIQRVNRETLCSSICCCSARRKALWDRCDFRECPTWTSPTGVKKDSWMSRNLKKERKTKLVAFLPWIYEICLNKNEISYLSIIHLLLSKIVVVVLFISRRRCFFHFGEVLNCLVDPLAEGTALKRLETNRMEKNLRKLTKVNYSGARILST